MSASKKLLTGQKGALLAIVVVMVAVVLALAFSPQDQPNAPVDPIVGLTNPPAEVVKHNEEQQAKNTSQHADPMLLVQALKKRLDENPKDMEALSMLGNAHMMIREFDKAAELYERLVALNVKELDARTNLALIRVQQKRYDDAVALLKENLQYSPDNGPSVFNLGIIYLDYLKQPNEASALWEPWLERNGGDPVGEQMRTMLSRYQKTPATAQPVTSSRI